MADALARSAPLTASNPDTRTAAQYLRFTLRDTSYAAPIAQIREVVEFQGMTRIPLAPDVVPGVLNLRGAVIPVVDLSVRIGGPPTRIGRRTCAIIVEMRVDDGVQPLGVIVDAVSEALEVDASRLEQRPAFGAGLPSQFVAGMLNLSDRFVVVLDLPQVLSLGELEQLVTHGTLARTNDHARQRERRA